MEILINVQNKIATLADPQSVIVCGNSDYSITFSFDAEWEEHKVKTTRFTYNGGYTDVVFEGNTCAVPILQNADAVFVGVFAGDLHTTTPAFINCKKSILCRGGSPQAPTEDVYSQLMAMINGGMVRGPQGEKGEKGDKGDAGSIKFIPVNELPTENIDESALYLVPIEDSEENRYSEYAYINGKWELLGAITVQVDHSEYVKFTDYASKDKAGVFKTADYMGIMVNPDTGVIFISPAAKTNIDKRSGARLPISVETLDYAVKVGITTNTETLTDEEKTSACDWLGAVKQYQSGGALRLYGVNRQGVQTNFLGADVADAINVGRVVVYMNDIGSEKSSEPNAALVTKTPIKPYQAANKNYVDNLPDYLTLTEEQKAKWKAWIESILA